MTGVLERTFAFIAQSSDNFLCLCTFLIIFNGVVVMPMCLSRSFVFPFVDLFLPSPYARIHGIICLAHYADTLKGSQACFGKYLDSFCCFYNVSIVYPISIRILLFPEIKCWRHNCKNFRGSVVCRDSKHRIIRSVKSFSRLDL